MLGSKWQAQQMGVDGLLKRKHLHEPVDHLAQQAHAAHHHSRPHSLHDHHQYSDSLHQECDCQHQHAHNQVSHESNNVRLWAMIALYLGETSRRANAPACAAV